jgi:hypothetical protein
MHNIACVAGRLRLVTLDMVLVKKRWRCNQSAAQCKAALLAARHAAGHSADGDMRSQARMAFVISSADNIRRMSKHHFFMRLPCLGAETLSRDLGCIECDLLRSPSRSGSYGEARLRHSTPPPQRTHAAIRHLCRACETNICCSKEYICENSNVAGRPISNRLLMLNLPASLEILRKSKQIECFF